MIARVHADLVDESEAFGSGPEDEHHVGQDDIEGGGLVSSAREPVRRPRAQVPRRNHRGNLIGGLARAEVGFDALAIALYRVGAESKWHGEALVRVAPIRLTG